MKNLNMSQKELSVLHTLLMDLPAKEIERLGINKVTYSKMANKSVAVANGRDWQAS